MKRIYLLLCICVCILISFSSFSKEVQVIKTNGHRAVITFWKVTYKMVTYSQTNGNLWTLQCSDPGSENCRQTTYSGKPIVIGMHEYSEKLFNEVLSEVMDMVDESIFDGKSEGYVGKKISTQTTDGKDKVLTFSASWKNANIKTGDVNYSIIINELDF